MKSDVTDLDRTAGYSFGSDSAMANSMRNHPAAQSPPGVSTDQTDLQNMLMQVATLASTAIPGADGAGVTLLDSDRPDIVVASAYFVRVIDAIQYSHGQGPCITAVTERRTVQSGALSEDRQWPQFSDRIRGLGVESVMSLPLKVNDNVVGTINVYGHGKEAFDLGSLEAGERFAESATTAVRNARDAAKERRLAAALGDRTSAHVAVQRAQGILMMRHLCTAKDADAMIDAVSRSNNQTFLAAALSIIARQEQSED